MSEPVSGAPRPGRAPVGERVVRPAEVEPPPRAFEEDDLEEIGRPEGPLDERHVDPFGIGSPDEPAPVTGAAEEPWREEVPAWEPLDTAEVEPEDPEPESQSDMGSPPPAGADEDAPGPGLTPAGSAPAPQPSFGRRRARRR